MFRFEHPQFFWLAAVAVVVALTVYLRPRLSRKDWLRWSSRSTYTRIVGTIYGKTAFNGLIVIALVLLILSAVNPQWGTKTENVESKTADIYLLFDISNSMLAEDVAPSRLEKARRLAMDLADAFKSDRVGLILFAGHAYMQSPLTTDWHAIQLYLNAAHPSQAGTQGTAIGEAIRLATRLKSESEVSRGGGLIVITDGEDHDSDAPAAIREAADQGWMTYVIGVGTENGANIPMEIGGVRDVKRDDSGQPVVTRMNRQLMVSLAQEGNGKYFDLADGRGIIEEVKNEMASLERSQLEKRSFSEYRSYYQWFLLGAMMILLLYVTIRYQYDVI